MGLDHGIKERVHLAHYKGLAESYDNYAEQYRLSTGILEMLGAKMGPDGSMDVSFDVAVWRKANAIHAWFVNTVQDGIDDCRDAYVEPEQLDELRSLCVRVLEASELVPDMVTNGKTLIDGEWVNRLEMGEVVLNSAVAQELLPAQEGFFFGSTDYDQWYVQDLVDTIFQLDRVAANELEDSDLYYWSSW